MSERKLSEYEKSIYYPKKKITVAVEKILEAELFLQSLNKYDIKDITFTRKGKVVKVQEKVLEDWSFCGLSNKDAVMYLEEDEIDIIEDNINTIISNVITGSYGRKDYNYLRETQSWAKSYYYELSWEEFLEMARKYQIWNDFESILGED